MWCWSGRGQVREMFTPGFELVGQIRMSFGKSSDGLFKVVCGGAACTVFCHSSRSDQLLCAGMTLTKGRRRKALVRGQGPSWETSFTEKWFLCVISYKLSAFIHATVDINEQLTTLTARLMQLQLANIMHARSSIRSFLSIKVV